MLCRNVIILFVLTASSSSCNGFWWGSGDTREVEQQQQQQQQQQQPIIKQVPSVSYFRTYTYQPVTFAATPPQHRTGSANPYQYQTQPKYPFINNPLNNWPQKQLSSSSQSSSAPTPSPQMAPSISSPSSSLSSSTPQNPSPQLNDYHVTSYQQHSSYQQSQPPPSPPSQHQSSSQISTQYPQSTLSASQLYNQQQQSQSQPQIQEHQQQPLSPSLQSLLNSQHLYNTGPVPQQYSIPTNNNNNNNDYFAPLPSTPIQHYSQSSTYINPITMSSGGSSSSSSSLPYKQNEFPYDPVNLQYFTNIAPFTVQHVQFVPCMCPVTLNIAGGGSSTSAGNGLSSSALPSTSPSAAQDIIANKRNDEILLSQPMQVESRDGEIKKSEEH